MENVWDATRFALFVYGLAALVSFLVAGVITLTFKAVRMHGARGAASAESQAKGFASPAKAGREREA